MRRVENRLLRPLVGTTVDVTHPLLAGNVCTVVGEQQVVVTAAAQERLNDIPEQAPIFGAEEPVADLLDRPAEFGMLLVVLQGIVVRLQCVYLGGGQAK